MYLEWLSVRMVSSLCCTSYPGCMDLPLDYSASFFHSNHRLVHTCCVPCLAFVPFSALIDFQRTLAGSPVFHLVLNRLSVAVSIASLLSPMFAPRTSEWPVGAKYGDVLTHCLYYGHAAHHSKTGWVFPTIFDVLTPFAADYKYYAPNAALR